MRRFAVFLLLLCPAFACGDEHEDHAVALAVKLGGTAKIDPKLDEQARVHVKFERGSDKILFQLAKLPNIGSLELADRGDVTDAGIAALRELPDLQKLSMRNAHLNDKDAAALGTLRNLTIVFLGDSKLTDQSFASLKRLTNLKMLDVMDAGITDKSTAVLKGFAKLEELNLAGTKVGDTGVGELHGLEKLKLLKLNRTPATRKGIDAIEAARGKDLKVEW